MPSENATAQPIPPPSTEALALARLRQKAISHPLQQCQLTIYVPPNAVGAIIGRGGRTILSIQQEAKRRSLGHDMGVRIHVVGGISNNNNNSSAAPSSGAATWNYNEYQQQQQQQQSASQQNESDDVDDWVPVTIRGDPIGCLEACRLIIPLVDRPQDPTYLTIVFDVPIHRAKHNLLVGKGGIVLASLSASYETRIMIPPNELMSNVESSGNIWEQRQQQQQQQSKDSNDAGAGMLFDLGSGGEAGSNNNMMSQANTTDLISNIIQLEGELDNVEQCLVRMLQIVAMEEKIVPTGIIIDCDTIASTEPPSTTPTKKSKSDKASPTEKTVANAIIVANPNRTLSSRSWRAVMRKTNTKIQRKNILDTEPSLVNEIDEIEGDDEDDVVDNDDVNKEETAAVRPHTKFIITGKNEQSVQKACAQLEKLLGLEVGSTEITLKVVPVETSPMGKGDDQPDKEGASGKKIRKRRGKKKAIAQPD